MKLILILHNSSASHGRKRKCLQKLCFTPFIYLFFIFFYSYRPRLLFVSSVPLCAIGRLHFRRTSGLLLQMWRYSRAPRKPSSPMLTISLPSVEKSDHWNSWTAPEFTSRLCNIGILCLSVCFTSNCSGFFLNLNNLMIRSEPSPARPGPAL